MIPISDVMNTAWTSGGGVLLEVKVISDGGLLGDERAPQASTLRSLRIGKLNDELDAAEEGLTRVVSLG